MGTEMQAEGLLSKTLKKTGKHSLIYGIGMSFTAISGIVLVPLYTRFLSPSDYGVYSLIGIICSLLFFLYDFGMVNAIFRWYYQYPPEEVAMQRRVINTAFIFLVTLASFFTILLWSCAPFLSKLILNTARFTWLIRLMLLGVLLQSLTWVPLSLLRIKERVSTFALVTISGMVLMIAANYALLSTGRGLAGIYEAYIIAYIFIAASLFFMTRQDYAVDFSFKELKGMLKFGLPYIPVLFFSWMIDFSDRYLLGRLSTLQEVGLYSVGYKLGQVMYMAEKTFLIAWVPLMLSIYQQHKDKAPQIFGGVFTYFTLFIFSLGLSISIFSPEIIRIFTSAEYYSAAMVVPWIALAYLLSGIYIYMLSGFIISKNVYMQPVILSVSALTNIGLNIAFIPKYGMMGAAYATVFSYAMVAAFTMLFAQKLYPITIEKARLIKIAVCSVGLYFISTFIRVSGLALSITVKTTLIIALFLMLYCIGFFTSGEMRRIRGILSNIGIVKNA